MDSSGTPSFPDDRPTYSVRSFCLEVLALGSNVLNPIPAEESSEIILSSSESPWGFLYFATSLSSCFPIAFLHGMASNALALGYFVGLLVLGRITHYQFSQAKNGAAPNIRKRESPARIFCFLVM